jgi:hypothetical protein
MDSEPSIYTIEMQSGVYDILTAQVQSNIYVQQESKERYTYNYAHRSTIPWTYYCDRDVFGYPLEAPSRQALYDSISTLQNMTEAETFEWTGWTVTIATISGIGVVTAAMYKSKDNLGRTNFPLFINVGV